MTETPENPTPIQTSPFVTVLPDGAGFQINLQMDQLRRWFLYDLEVEQAEEILQCSKSAIPVSEEGAEIESRFSQERLSMLRGIEALVEEYAYMVGTTLTTARDHVSGHGMDDEEFVAQAYIATIAAYSGIIGFLSAFTHVGLLTPNIQIAGVTATEKER